MWIERVLGVGQVVKELSIGFSCPLYCGGSLLVPFLAGLSSGIVLGIVLTLGFILCFIVHWPHPGFDRAPSPHLVPSASSVIRRRLAGYVVHE